ncbi:TrkH family potassium uptake protein [Paenibacillus athensensis]|uniref:Trk family potassium uptake protein n=1 Tax=Paenibacillus athensensis TaxID=1967502 RepID=A0A4Y8Q8E0_9BACL|nr:TrkH family potassium uptake protein [Paenibacillus athensensis]MCD1259768.1 TrkH family potassium uptake protein [Paenibacillus athensensis]
MKKIKNPLLRLMPPQILVLGFAGIILCGTLLLMLPIATTGSGTLPFIDALFTATSATCVTGLVVVDTGTSFTTFGQVVIILLIQLGGLGFMTMSTLIAFVLRKKITLKERLILQEALNQGSMEGIVRLIRKVLLYSLGIEAIGAVLFTARLSFDLDFPKALYYGVWHSISMFNNAGFDLFGPITGPFSSFTSYANDFVMNVTAMSLVVCGGIGFIVISDLLEFKRTRKLSLHSKVVLSMTAFLIVFGAIVIFVFEYTNTKTLGPLHLGGKVLASFFQSIAPRTAGPNTVDIGSLRQASQFFIIVLMFIGASPGSTGGGIKTTTFTILIGAMIAMIRGKEDIVIFRFRLAQNRILKAITLVMIALFLVIFVSMLLSTTEDAQFLKILFEVTSAFGTVGLSMGLTPALTVFGKIMISVMMFAGRLGPITLAYALQPKPEKELYRYPEGKITIG